MNDIKEYELLIDEKPAKHFVYEAERINKFIEDNDISPAAMLGYLNDFAYIVKTLNKRYADDVRFEYLSYALGDSVFHGWDGKSEPMQNMSKIVDMIEDRIAEIYALALCGAGYKMEITQNPNGTKDGKYVKIHDESED